MGSYEFRYRPRAPLAFLTFCLTVSSLFSIVYIRAGPTEWPRYSCLVVPLVFLVVTWEFVRYGRHEAIVVSPTGVRHVGRNGQTTKEIQWSELSELKTLSLGDDSDGILVIKGSGGFIEAYRHLRNFKALEYALAEALNTDRSERWATVKKSLEKSLPASELQRRESGSPLD